jgi:hypothetical protein
LELAAKMSFDKNATSKIIRHAVSEFSKHGLGSDYPGYHTINHNLEVAFVSLLSAGNQKLENKIPDKDIKNLFVAALFMILIQEKSLKNLMRIILNSLLGTMKNWASLSTRLV